MKCCLPVVQQVSAATHPGFFAVSLCLIFKPDIISNIYTKKLYDIITVYIVSGLSFLDALPVETATNIRVCHLRQEVELVRADVLVCLRFGVSYRV